MAKIVLYLKNTADDKILEASRIEGMLEKQREVAWAFLMPMPNDPMATIGHKLYHNIDFAVVISVSKGQTLLPKMTGLAALFRELLKNSDAQCSHVYVAYHHCFKGGSVKPLHYHYLMVKRDDFSRTDYLDYYVNRHATFGLETPHIDYYQTYIDEQASNSFASEFGIQAVQAINVSEMHIEDLPQFLNSGVFEDLGPKAIEDEMRFVDRENSVMFTLALKAYSNDYEATLA